MTDAELRGMARADLERYANATIGFSEYRDRMDKIRDQIENTVKPLKQISVQTSKSDDYDKLINELVDMGMEYNEMKNEARLTCLQIERRVSKIGGIEGAILYRRYCELKEWSEVCHDYS